MVTEEGEAALDEYTPVRDMTLQQLWEEREDLRDEVYRLQNRKTHIEQEMHRRIREGNPDFDEYSAGSVEYSEGPMALRLTYNREYEFSDQGLRELARLAHEQPDLITPGEYEALVKTKLVVDGNKYNALKKRGGLLADMLETCRMLKRYTPQFERRHRE